MDLNSKVTQLEDEIKVLKKEVQAVLLDLRENMLNRENPFSPQPLVAPRAAVAVSPPPVAEEKKAPVVEELPKEEPPKKEEVALPEAITGAFQADEPIEFLKKKEVPQAADDGELVLAWKPVDGSEKSECLPGSKNATGDKPQQKRSGKHNQPG